MVKLAREITSKIEVFLTCTCLEATIIAFESPWSYSRFPCSSPFTKLATSTVMILSRLHLFQIWSLPFSTGCLFLFFLKMSDNIFENNPLEDNPIWIEHSEDGVDKWRPELAIITKPCCFDGPSQFYCVEQWENASVYRQDLKHLLRVACHYRYAMPDLADSAC